MRASPMTSAPRADLLQYAQDTDLRLMYVGRIALGKTQAREFGVQAGEEWIYAVGLRHSGSPARSPSA